MKTPRFSHFNTYKISLLAQIGLLYLLVTGTLPWLQYVLIGVIVVERAFVSLLLWIVARLQKEMAQKLMQAIQQSQASGMPIQRPFDQEA
jgi:hypothetical protein